MVIKIVGILLGFVAGVASYPWLNQYMFALIAAIGAVAIGIVVYLIVVNILKDLTT